MNTCASFGRVKLGVFRIAFRWAWANETSYPGLGPKQGGERLPDLAFPHFLLIFHRAGCGLTSSALVRTPAFLGSIALTSPIIQAVATSIWPETPLHQGYAWSDQGHGNHGRFQNGLVLRQPPLVRLLVPPNREVVCKSA